MIKNFEEVDREEYERRVRHRAEGELTEHEHRAADLIDPLEELHVGQVLTETRFREYRDRYGGCFEAGMGAEAILQLLRGLDLNGLSGELREALELTSGLKRKRVIRRLEVVEAFRRSGNNPEWMVLSILPVLPPELRPLLDLGSNRFVTSDLNALYRRVINRNNRLKRLMRLSAPEIIVRNEKRMLQEAVDALIDNRVSKNPVRNRGNSRFKLKALSDLLRGKQGRFRQNLLGKRVDYSGRSVIIAGPELRVNQCGLPRYMALELFKPYIINRLVKKGYAHNAKHAGRVAESETPQVLEVLEEVVRGRPVILNRGTDAAPLGGSGIRADPGRREGDPVTSACMLGLQCGLRRRSDGGAPATVERGCHGGAPAHDEQVQHPITQLRGADHGPGARHGARLLLHHPARRGGEGSGEGVPGL